MDKTVVIEPFDEHNRAVVSNGHPPDWVNPAPTGRYNLVVIGAGTAGLVTAAGAAGLGAKVALVEKHLMGGDCLNVGCVPSKALIRASRAFADVRDAGSIGCELAQAFRRFGSKVHLIEALGQILIREDRDAAVVIEKQFAREGIEFSCNHNVIRVEWRGAEKVVFTECDCHKGGLAVDAILVGVGRAPNVEGLNLEAAGVEYDKKAGVKVDDRLRTANPRIYAAGDICSAYKFTHTADAAARIVIQNALFVGRKKASALTIPWCTYTDPEIAHVGLYEKEAKEKGLEVDTFVQEFKDLDRAILDGESEGLIKVHVENGTDKILGATIVARHAGEMISELTLAMVGGLGLKTIAQTIHPYPTQAESIKRVADAYNRTRLTPFAKTALGSWLRWNR
ncbi:MAG TPA: hypothetical protein DCZ01_04630 [Elusimicrobia bacterium]|nr:MAG: hypothetical protein A2X37_03610 [Elusimicrobia bacterium GWA2_66_18]OGR75271.1 MAG: hypothetical protein A2X40_05995 [Elusimicrobia bacterium GWC2_65_9]HAZ07811.1 hypothetical protein [Elusimicrobiota bacterium]